MKSKNIFFRGTALAISILLSLSSFVGCTSKNSSESEKDATNNGPKEPVKIHYFRANTTPPSDWELKAAHDYILESTGYDIQWVTAAQGAAEEKLNIMFSSRDNLDLVGRNVKDTMAKGLIQSLDEPMRKYGQNMMNNSKIPKEIWTLLSNKDGKIYGMPFHIPMAGTPIMFRADWLKKINLPMPTTIDEYENVVKTMIEKNAAPNGQTVGILGSLDDLNIGLSAGFTGEPINSIAGGYYIKDSSNKFVNAIQYPGYKDFVTKLSDWYKKGYFYKENFGMNTTNMRELVAKDSVATSIAWVSTITLSTWWKTDGAKAPGADYIYNTKGIKGPKGLCETSPGFSSSGYVVPEWSKKAEDVVKFMNWVYEKPEHFAMTMGMKFDTDLKWVDKDKGVAQLINGKKSTDYTNPMYIASNVLESGLNIMGSDGKLQPHQQKGFIEGMFFNSERAVKNVAWEYLFDSSAISKDNPMVNDINRAISENLLKFIMGVRPMSEYDSFVKEVEKIGLNNVNEYITKMYKEKK